jgi:hypothetical protein
MARPAPFLAAVAALALAPVAPPARAEGPTEGTIDAVEARVEVLGKPVRVGENIELPEGFIRVEEAGTEDQQIGSFSVVPAASLRATAATRTAPGAEVPVAEAPAPEATPAAGSATPAELGVALGGAPEPACRAERNAYLRELWKPSGIDVTDADALLEGLEGAGYGPRTGFYWFALATDPFRPLAWSSDLRDRAEALERCVRERRDEQ